MEEERMGSEDVTEKERSSEAKQNVKQEVEHVDVVNAVEEEEDGGPPTGFRPIPPLPPEPLSSPVELAVAKEEQKIPCEVGPADEDSLSPPPGYQFPTPTAMAPPPILNVGKSLPFETPLPPQPESVCRLRAQPPAYQFPSSRTMVSLPMNDVEKVPLHSPAQVSHLTAPAHPPPEAPVQESGTMPPLQRPPPKPQTPTAQPMMPPQPAVHGSHPQSRPPLPAPTYEMAQMVCGSCQRLLSYIRGARYVQCSCCQTVNYVLEEHQVGQVKCGSCSLLLMYPYGAPSVKCSSCYSVTEIGEHNKRPPWSIQQGRAPPASSTVR